MRFDFHPGHAFDVAASSLVTSVANSCYQTKRSKETAPNADNHDEIATEFAEISAAEGNIENAGFST